jgi:hypothetical protein
VKFDMTATNLIAILSRTLITLSPLLHIGHPFRHVVVSHITYLWSPSPSGHRYPRSPRLRITQAVFTTFLSRHYCRCPPLLLIQAILPSIFPYPGNIAFHLSLPGQYCPLFFPYLGSIVLHYNLYPGSIVLHYNPYPGSIVLHYNLYPDIIVVHYDPYLGILLFSLPYPGIFALPLEPYPSVTLLLLLPLPHALCSPNLVYHAHYMINTLFWDYTHFRLEYDHDLTLHPHIMTVICSHRGYIDFSSCYAFTCV